MCEEKVKTKKGNYRKIIFVNFTNRKKYRYKFCSPSCFEKWHIMNAQQAAPQELLEKEVTKTYIDEEFKEEEEPNQIAEKKPAKVKYEDPISNKEYNIYENNIVNEATPLKVMTESQKEPMQYFRYDRNTGKREIVYRIKTDSEKIRDANLTLKIKYKKDTSEGVTQYEIE